MPTICTDSAAQMFARATPNSTVAAVLRSMASFRLFVVSICCATPSRRPRLSDAPCADSCAATERKALVLAEVPMRAAEGTVLDVSAVAYLLLLGMSARILSRPQPT